MNTELLDQLSDRINADLDGRADADKLWDDLRQEEIYADVTYTQFLDTYANLAGW